MVVNFFYCVVINVILTFKGYDIKRRELTLYIMAIDVSLVSQHFIDNLQLAISGCQMEATNIIIQSPRAIS